MGQMTSEREMEKSPLQIMDASLHLDAYEIVFAAFVTTKGIAWIRRSWIFVPH
jgi:hypothetical protein